LPITGHPHGGFAASMALVFAKQEHIIPAKGQVLF
jgi:hypothetical protein